MSFPAHSSYRDSGVDWLGAIPTTWEQVPFWTLFRRVKRSGYPDEQLLSVYRDYGVIRKADRDDNFNKPSEDLSAYQLVEEGDLAINKMKAWQGSVGISDYRGIVSPAYFVYEALHSQSHRFLHYLLRSAEYTTGYLALSKGIRVNQWDLDPAYHSRMPVLLPSREEQITIAAFLDRETAKIDALIEEQRRLIALLKEKRQAVISHAVTKGLDPNAPMKESGIAWLGEVPAHWSLTKVKHVCSHVVDCLHTTPTYDGDLLYPAIRTADIERGKLLLEQARLVSQEVYDERIARLRPIAGDVLYSREGERFGLAALVPQDVDLCLGQRMMMFRVVPQSSAPYLMWALNSDAVYQQVLAGLGGATSPHINIGDIVNFSIPEPPFAEQEAIAARIGGEIEALDNLADVAANAIALLQERRSALISAAVTGNIDVRETAKVLPFPVDRARARALVATEIIERCASQPTFGRVKFQKIAFLAEGYVGVSELKGSYLREAAGPLDRALIEEMENGAHAMAGVERDQPGGPGTTVSYRLGQPRGAHRQELTDWLGEERSAKLDKLIADFADLTTKGAEAVATLYGVWNDALIDGQSPSDDEIIAGFLNDWHSEKPKKFRTAELPTWLDWMRRHGIVPTGSGPKTTTGRLFV